MSDWLWRFFNEPMTENMWALGFILILLGLTLIGVSVPWIVYLRDRTPLPPPAAEPEPERPDLEQTEGLLLRARPVEVEQRGAHAAEPGVDRPYLWHVRSGDFAEGRRPWPRG